MSITKDAIQHLEKTVLLNDVNEELSKIQTNSALVVIPHEFSLQNLEEYMPKRDSYRFLFKTKSINDFGKYCQEFDKEGAKCFVDSDRMKAKAIFDLGVEAVPLHQQHKAILTIDKTAAFKALLMVDGQRMSQRDASNFIDDWSGDMVIISKNGDVMPFNQASKQLREITIEQVSKVESNVNDFGESMSAMEKIEAKNQDVIPATILFACNPYHGLLPREFTIRVSILTGGSKPEISFRIIKLEAQEEDMANEFKDILVETFKDSELKTFIGEG